MKGMKERLVKKMKLITTVKTLKQGLALHKSSIDRTIHHLRDEIVAESSQIKGSVTPRFLEFEAAAEQEQEQNLEDDRGILLEFEENCPPGGEDSVVFYTTGLRGVRKTFEACRRVRFLLENHKVMFREREMFQWIQSLEKRCGGCLVGKLHLQGCSLQIEIHWRSKRSCVIEREREAQEASRRNLTG